MDLLSLSPSHLSSAPRPSTGSRGTLDSYQQRDSTDAWLDASLEDIQNSWMASRRARPHAAAPAPAPHQLASPLRALPFDTAPASVSARSHASQRPLTAAAAVQPAVNAQYSLKGLVTAGPPTSSNSTVTTTLPTATAWTPQKDGSREAQYLGDQHCSFGAPAVEQEACPAVPENPDWLKDLNLGNLRNRRQYLLGAPAGTPWASGGGSGSSTEFVTHVRAAGLSAGSSSSGSWFEDSTQKLSGDGVTPRQEMSLGQEVSLDWDNLRHSSESWDWNVPGPIPLAAPISGHVAPFGEHPSAVDVAHPSAGDLSHLLPRSSTAACAKCTQPLASSSLYETSGEGVSLTGLRNKKVNVKRSSPRIAGRRQVSWSDGSGFKMEGGGRTEVQRVLVLGTRNGSPWRQRTGSVERAQTGGTGKMCRPGN